MEHHNFHHIGPHMSIPTPNFYELAPQFYQTSRLHPVKESYKSNAVDMGSVVHSIELEAYAAVLKAFKVQSDLLTWEKEALITELRKELKVTDQEHRKILSGISSDESINKLREMQLSTSCARDTPSSVTYATGFVPCSVSSAPHQFLKIINADVSTMQRYMPHNQPVASPITVFLNKDHPRNGELCAYSSRNTEKRVRVNVADVTYPSESNYRTPVQPQMNFIQAPSAVAKVNKKSGLIQIRATETLLNETLQIMVHSPDQLEKAKTILMEQERDILEALEKLADVSDDDDDSPKGSRCHESEEKFRRTGKRGRTPYG